MLQRLANLAVSKSQFHEIEDDMLSIFGLFYKTVGVQKPESAFSEMSGCEPALANNIIQLFFLCQQQDNFRILGRNIRRASAALARMDPEMHESVHLRCFRTKITQ